MPSQFYYHLHSIHVKWRGSGKVMLRPRAGAKSKLFPTPLLSTCVIQSWVAHNLASSTTHCRSVCREWTRNEEQVYLYVQQVMDEEDQQNTMRKGPGECIQTTRKKWRGSVIRIISTLNKEPHIWPWLSTRGTGFKGLIGCSKLCSPSELEKKQPAKDNTRSWSQAPKWNKEHYLGTVALEPVSSWYKFWPPMTRSSIPCGKGANDLPQPCFKSLESSENAMAPSAHVPQQNGILPWGSCRWPRVRRIRTKMWRYYGQWRNLGMRHDSC
jgi:hypothetical protein